MELRQLTTFKAVATHLSFTRAAVALDYAQSSVTAQIQALEDEIGLPLFDRVGRRVSLTAAGQRLLWYADKMLELAAEAKAAVAGATTPTGTLTISAPETICSYRLPVVLQEFRQHFPQVRLTFKPLPSSELRQAVSEGTLDVAFLLDEPLQANNLNIEILRDEAIWLVGPPDHRLASFVRVLPGDIEGEPLLLTESGCTYRSLFKRALAEAGVHPNVIMEFSSVDSIKQCVMAGMGLTVLPAVAVQREVESGELVAIKWAGSPISVALQMAWHRDKWISPALHEFLCLARTRLQLLAEPAQALWLTAS